MTFLDAISFTVLFLSLSVMVSFGCYFIFKKEDNNGESDRNR